MTIYLSINTHAISLHIHPISKSLITIILNMESIICSTGNGVSPAYVSKRKRRIAIKVKATLYIVSRLAVKGLGLFEVTDLSVNVSERESEH